MTHKKCPACGQTIGRSSIAGKARMAKLSKEERSALGRMAVQKRWERTKSNPASQPEN